MQRLFVEFDQYEIALLKATHKRMVRRYKEEGKNSPTLQDVIRGAVRVALHLLEGESAVHDVEELRSILEPVERRDMVLSQSLPGSARQPEEDPQ